MVEGMTPLEELSQLLLRKGRIILVAEDSIDLRSLRGKNSIYVLQLPEASTAAGGRAGGFGERRIEKIYGFQYQDGVCEKIVETDEPLKLEKIELPYHATALPVLMSDGTEKIVSGVIDPEFIQSYKQLT